MKAKITNYQLMSIIAAYVCGATTIIISSSATSIAKQDSWISVIVAAAVGTAVIWINTYLGGLYPDKTYVEVIQLLLGKWIGLFFSLNFIMMCLIGTSELIWYVGDFFTTQYMKNTPLYSINVLFSAAVAIALIYGIETIGRASEIFFYFIVFMFAASVFLAAPNVDVNNMLPVMENGFEPILKGALPVLSFTALPTIILNMLYPVNIENINEAKKAIFCGYFIGMAVTFVSALICILVMGSCITSSSRFPVFFLTKEIDVGIIFTRLEALIVIVWILTIFNNTVFFFYGGLLGLAQMLKLSDYKKIILPLALVIMVYSDFIYKDVQYEMKWDTEIWPLYIITLGVVLPLLMIFIHHIRKGFFKM